jgi:hypothetical protein
MKVRAVALSQFGEKNIRPGMPMAMLEDALVPVYFYHRYQVEAVTKCIGGMYYTYALRNDGQVITRTLTKSRTTPGAEYRDRLPGPEIPSLTGSYRAIDPPATGGV